MQGLLLVFWGDDTKAWQSQTWLLHLHWFLGPHRLTCASYTFSNCFRHLCLVWRLMNKVRRSTIVAVWYLWTDFVNLFLEVISLCRVNSRFRLLLSSSCLDVFLTILDRIYVFFNLSPKRPSIKVKSWTALQLTFCSFPLFLTLGKLSRDVWSDLLSKWGFASKWTVFLDELC